ncbi:MAG: DNA polymerase III subunit chi [Alphaproteobacteria bacterium]
MSVDVRFYHLTKSALEQSLPIMLEKTIERGKRATVVIPEKDRLKSINTLLWVYNDKGFLPHGSSVEGSPELQPIWLTQNFENINQSSYAFFADGSFPADAEQIADLEVCALMFNGLDGDMVQQARQVWVKLKDAGLDLTYWQQSDRGWKQGATTKKEEA